VEGVEELPVVSVRINNQSPFNISPDNNGITILRLQSLFEDIDFTK
jgi:hypothetical protein